MPCRISLRHTDFFKEIQRYLTTMHGNQVPVIELSFIDNYSWKELPLNLTREVVELQQEEYMHENCWDNKYFLINLDTEVWKNGSVAKIWLKVMSKKRGWQVTKSQPLNPPLLWLWKFWIKEFKIALVTSFILLLNWNIVSFKLYILKYKKIVNICLNIWIYTQVRQKRLIFTQNWCEKHCCQNLIKASVHTNCHVLDSKSQFLFKVYHTEELTGAKKLKKPYKS